MLSRQPLQNYQVVSTGAKLNTYDSGLFGGLWRRGSTVETLQFWTFITSMLFQIGTLISGLVALGQGGNPEVLTTVLWLELIVQTVEVTWYSGVGYYYVVRKDRDVPVYWRYADWILTTPVMLISVLFFTLWESDKDCTTNDNLLNDGSRVGAVVAIVLADWLMLSYGWAYEASRPSGIDGSSVRLAVLTKNFYNQYFACGMFNALWLGFIPFVGAFIPLFVIVGNAYSGWGMAAILITFFTWSLYGVVALLGEYDHLGQQARNAAYNTLDIFSKNAVGIVIATVALNNDHVVDPYGC